MTEVPGCDCHDRVTELERQVAALAAVAADWDAAFSMIAPQANPERCPRCRSCRRACTCPPATITALPAAADSTP